jgi:hypothetical protein
MAVPLVADCWETNLNPVEDEAKAKWVDNRFLWKKSLHQYTFCQFFGKEVTL